MCFSKAHRDCSPANPFTSQIFQTFGRSELINKSIYYISTEVSDVFADIIGSQQTITLGVDHLALVVSHSRSPYDAQSHSLRLISVVFFHRFVT